MSNKKIGVIVAIELDAVLSKYGTPAEAKEYPGYTVMTYVNDSFTMYVTQSGAGEIAAAAATQFLISVYGVDMILNFGVVGALTEEMSLAEACVVDKVIHYDFITDGWLNLKPGQYLGYDSPFISTSTELVDEALRVFPGLKKVVCASADKFVDDPAAKAALSEKYGADICEMEAAGVVLTCHRNNVPCLLIKAVSDGLTGGAKEFMTELNRVSLECFDAADKIIRNITL